MFCFYSHVSHASHTWKSAYLLNCELTHEKELVLELKAHTCKLHITGTPFGRENSNRAWEVAHHVHADAGGVISDSTKQEYVQKLTSWLLLPAQLDAQGKGPARLMYAMEGSNGSKSVLQAKRAKGYTDAYKNAIANKEVGDVRKSIPVLKCLLDFAIAEVLKTSSTQPKKYCTIVFQQCPMEAGIVKQTHFKAFYVCCRGYGTFLKHECLFSVSDPFSAEAKKKARHQTALLNQQ